MPKIDSLEKFKEHFGETWVYACSTNGPDWLSSRFSILEQEALNEDTFWIYREFLRFEKDEYKPFTSKALEDFLCDNLDLQERQNFRRMFLHISTEHPKMVAFTPNEDYGRQDRQVRMSAGRFFRKYLPGVDDQTVRQLANEVSCETQPSELHFAHTEEDIMWVYSNEVNFQSCMSGYKFNGKDHPVRAYAGPDTAVAYLLSKGGDQVTSRTVVNVREKTWLRIYGDDSQMRTLLLAEGYEQSNTCLEFARLKYIEIDGTVLCPYLDGDATTADIEERGGERYIVPKAHGAGDFRCTGTDGTFEGPEEVYECPHCEERYDEDDWDNARMFSERENTVFCENCSDEFTYAIVGRDFNSVHCDKLYDYVEDRYNSLYEYEGATYIEEALPSFDLFLWENNMEVYHLEETTECFMSGERFPSVEAIPVYDAESGSVEQLDPFYNWFGDTDFFLGFSDNTIELIFAPSGQELDDVQEARGLDYIGSPDEFIQALKFTSEASCGRTAQYTTIRGLLLNSFSSDPYVREILTNKAFMLGEDYALSA